MQWAIDGQQKATRCADAFGKTCGIGPIEHAIEPLDTPQATNGGALYAAFCSATRKERVGESGLFYV
jgi:hypothetical protein